MKVLPALTFWILWFGDCFCMDHKMMMVMPTYFQWTIKVKYLIKEWDVKTPGYYALAFVATFILAMSIELMNAFRYNIQVASIERG